MKKMKWNELNKKEKKKRIKKTYDSIKDDEESVNLFQRFKKINPDVEVTLKEFFVFMERGR